MQTLKQVLAGESLIHSKFKDIVFPFFARKHNPYSVKYKKDKILVKITSHSKDAIVDIVSEDNKNFSFFERIASLDDRVVFEYTCRNLTELLNCEAHWGVDSLGKVFDLINTERFRTKLTKIRKIKKGLFWVNSVSYPIQIDKSIDYTRPRKKEKFTNSLVIRLTNADNRAIQKFKNNFKFKTISQAAREMIRRNQIEMKEKNDRLST